MDKRVTQRVTQRQAALLFRRGCESRRSYDDNGGVRIQVGRHTMGRKLPDSPATWDGNWWWVWCHRGTDNPYAEFQVGQVVPNGVIKEVWFWGRSKCGAVLLV